MLAPDDPGFPPRLNPSSAPACMNTPLSHLLSRKESGTVITIAPTALTIEAVQLMNDRHIGALLVTDEENHLLGIFTERDVLSRIVGQDRNPHTTPVSAVMTRRLVTTTPDTTVEQAMTLFMSHRIRHLPVLDGTTLVGVISIGDVNRLLLEAHELEAQHLRDYIQGDVSAMM